MATKHLIKMKVGDGTLIAQYSEMDSLTFTVEINESVSPSTTKPRYLQITPDIARVLIDMTRHNHELDIERWEAEHPSR